MLPYTICIYFHESAVWYNKLSCQGEVVDRISDHVELAATYVQNGGLELQKAVAYKQSNRKVSNFVFKNKLRCITPCIAVPLNGTIHRAK